MSHNLNTSNCSQPFKKRLIEKKYENKNIKISNSHRKLLPENHPAKEYEEWTFYPLDPYHPEHSENLRELLIKEEQIETLEEDICKLMNDNENLLKEYFNARDKIFNWKSEDEQKKK